MRISDDFILRTVADENILIPVGQAALRVKGLIALSESGALLLERIREGVTADDLVATLTGDYEVSEAEARRDTEEFLAQLRELNILLED